MLPIIKKLNLAKEFYFNEGCYIVEISNSEDDPNLSIARVRVEPGVTTKLHKLKNTIERYVIIEGDGRVEIGLEQPQSVHVGDVVIIPPLCPQKITNTGKIDLIFFAICTPRFVKSSYEEVAS